MRIILATMILFSITTFAKENKAKKESRQHEAHVHGGATLNIAFDQLKGKLEFKAASAGVVGFEHTAKSEKDKKTVSESISTFEAKISQLVQFDSSLGCVYAKEKIELVPESENKDQDDKDHGKKHGEHSDFVAVFNITCTKPITGSKVTFDFTSMKKIKDLDVTFLADTVQKTVEVKSKPVVLELK